jgi:hypothetical protein
MRPKARGMADHAVPPDWLEESDPGSTACLFRTVPATLTGAAQLELMEFPAAVI